MSSPKINVVLGILSSIVLGSLMPVFAIVLMKVMFSLNIINPNLRSDADFYCGMILIIAFMGFGFGFI